MSEQDVQIALTAAFLTQHGTVAITVNERRTGWTRTATGATKASTAPPLPPQTVALIDQSAATAPASIGERTVDGTEGVQTMMVLGLPGLDIAEGDTFDLGAFHYVVATMFPFNGYEIRAMVERHNPRRA